MAPAAEQGLQIPVRAQIAGGSEVVTAVCDDAAAESDEYEKLHAKYAHAAGNSAETSNQR